MDRLRHDLIVSLRRLRRSPGFTIAVIVTLALGIGANTTIFTAVNAIHLRIGAAIGIAGALAASRLFAPILYGVSSTDPATYSLALALMALVAFAACWFPARKAITVDPVRSLRTE